MLATLTLEPREGENHVPDATYRLTMRKGPDLGQQFPLEADTITIGRDPAADLVINDPEVSRQHARLTRRGDHFLIQDLGSTNGTFLDGRRLAGDPVPLAPGQLITIGSNVSLVFEGEPDIAATIMAVDEPADEEPSTELGVGVFDFPEELEPVWPDEDEFPVFDRVETTPLEERDTILDHPSPPPDLSYREEPGDLLPDFGPPASQSAPSEPYLRQERVDYRSAPPPPPQAPAPPRNNRTRNIIVIVLALILLCCCCFVLTGYFYWGDLLMEYLGLY
jgi:predicted component of type VI protein secretion system